jgi:hypothetical protein
MLQNTIIEAFQLAQQNGGVSFNQYEINPNNGFMVAFSGREVVLNIHEFTEAKLAQYVNQNADVLQSVSNAFVGVWFNTTDNNYYLDISEHVLDKELALRSGMLRDQKAIFNLNDMTEIALPERQKTGTEWQKRTYINQKVRELL